MAMGRPSLAAAAALAAALLTAALLVQMGKAEKLGEGYRTLMMRGGDLCRDDEYFSEDSLAKIANYCLLVTEQEDCLQYCIFTKLGMQKEADWDRNVTTTLLLPVITEYYPPNTREKDIRLDIKYCIEKSLLPPDAELIPTDYCEVAEYVHFCIREHFDKEKKPDCYAHLFENDY